MDMTPPLVGEGLTPDLLGDAAQLSARLVAREHPQKWAATGLLDSLAALDIPVETALSSASYHTIASTLGHQRADRSPHHCRHYRTGTRASSRTTTAGVRASTDRLGESEEAEQGLADEQ
jgi:hypothetical protein